MAIAAGVPRPGIWYGKIGTYPIILCVENDKAAYYYPGQSSDISLDMRGDEWTETIRGEITGHWLIPQPEQEPSLLNGVWRNARSKAKQDVELWYLGEVPSACSSALYQQALLLPNEPRLSLPLPKAGQVAAIQRIGAVVRPNGELWVWSEDQRQPKLMGENFLRVAVGWHHTVAIKSDGSLWGWGSNARGQLGAQEVTGDEPVHMGDGFVAVAANDAYTVAVQQDGTLWSWGGAEQSGDGDLLEKLKAKPRLMGKSFVSVSAGDSAFAALKSDGTLWMWGRGQDGQLGLGNGGSWFYRQSSDEDLPALVGKDFAAVSAGYAHTMAVRTDGTLWAWGRGELGDGHEQESRVPINIGSGYALAVAGYINSAALKADGSLWLWGRNDSGIFGDCTTQTHLKPIEVGSGFVQAALGTDFLVALKSDGSVWTWGWPWDGDQIDTPRACRKSAKVAFGDGINAWDKPVSRSIQLNLPEPRGSGGIVSITAGRSHSAFVTADGGLWTWGSNECGQLATGTTEYRNTPQQSGNGFEEVFADINDTLALMKDGNLWRWGPISSHCGLVTSKSVAIAPVKIFPGTVRLLQDRSFGRALGLRSDGAILDWHYDYETPKEPVQFGRDVREIATGLQSDRAGIYGSYAVKRDGTLWELAQYPIKPAPKQVGKDFVHVVIGVDHAYGIKTDGSLWAWGDNQNHQLGDGTQISRSDPVSIGSGFVQVATGRFHGIALASNGSVWTWGDNEAGVVGDGTTISPVRPVKIGTGFVRIAAGDYHNLALKADGTLWAWGNNEDGQLGDGTNVRRTVPVQIYPAVAGPKTAVPTTTMPSSVTGVHTGLYRSCAFYRDNSAKCWGDSQAEPVESPKRIAFEDKEQASRWLAANGSDGSRNIACTGEKANECDRLEAKHPFLRGALSIAHDHETVCALMKNRKIRCTARYPEQFVVDAVSDVVQFDFSGGHGCALQADDRVKCWGDNSRGELGVVTAHLPDRGVAMEVTGL